MEHQPICFVCNNKMVDKFKHFNVKTLAKCQQVFDIRSRFHLKYANVRLPLMPGGSEGYHIKCYKVFTAVRTRSNNMLSKEYVIDKYLDRQMRLKMERQDNPVSNICVHEVDIVSDRKLDAFECTSNFNVGETSADGCKNIKPPKVEVPFVKMCLFCNQLKKDNNDHELVNVASIDCLKSEAIACKDLDVLQKLDSIEFEEIWWHSHCRMTYGDNVATTSLTTAVTDIVISNSAHLNDFDGRRVAELSSVIDMKLDLPDIPCNLNTQSRECGNGDEKTETSKEDANFVSKCIFCNKNKIMHKRKLNKLVKLTSLGSVRALAVESKDLDLLHKLESMEIGQMWYHRNCKETYGDNTCVKKRENDELDTEPAQYGSMNKEFCKFIQREIIRNDRSIFLSLLNEIYKDTSQSKREKHTEEQLETKLNQTFDEELKIVEFNGTKIVTRINSDVTNTLFSAMEYEYILQRAALSMRREVFKCDTQNGLSGNVVKFFTTVINGAVKNLNPMIGGKAESLSRSTINAILNRNTIKPGRYDVCEGCLSSNRMVVPLEHNLDCYYSMLNMLHTQNNQTYLRKVALCWECHKELQNAVAFRKKITQAHKILATTNKNIIHNNHHSFSNLDTTLKTRYDYVFSHDSVNIDASIIDVPIKTEYVDESKHIDVGIKEDDEQDSDASVNDDCDQNVDISLKDDSKRYFDVTVKDDDNKQYIDGIIINANKQDVDVITKDFKEQYVDVRRNFDAIGHQSYGNVQKEIKTQCARVEKRKKKICKKQSQINTKKTDTAKHRWRYKNSTKCKLVKWNTKEIVKSNAYTKVLLKPHEVTMLWQRERRLLSYKTESRNCELCASTYKDDTSLRVHMEAFHSPKIGEYECDVCHKRAHSKESIRKHCISHNYMYHCRLCPHKCWGRDDMVKHFKGEHGNALKCLKCNMKFGVHEKEEFYKHYNLHTEHVCDYCGKKCRKKSTLISHMRNRHLPIVCEVCNARFSRIPALNEHKKLKHVKNPTETAYCVECDVQFDNENMYKRHCKTSTKHVPKVINKYHPCTGCDKVFAYRWSMLKHYKYHHLQLRNFDCNICSRSYMCGYQLRQHIDTHHLNMPAPKDKVCDYCGRGFATKNILKNHIRTHTGARPFACERCPAAFGQRSALVTHVRKTHGVHIMYRDVPLPKEDPL